ncbi:solute carrier family 22 member 1-like [Schistocerca piceifrons]|uniref:solute carrier family 22 member 1-like n=1 Tax=Schistocerca piceifrons TaxID=274613 RepID=UPI001F5FADC9|nr:solute carrier family 22 member 1-like [Schistocerca piceifrons]
MGLRPDAISPQMATSLLWISDAGIPYLQKKNDCPLLLMLGCFQVVLTMYASAADGTAWSYEKPKVAPAFEDVLDSIGSRGKFQTRITVIFICFAQCLNMLSISVLYLAVHTPNHWCHVPGIEHTNLTLEEWKNITIPREGDIFSKCLMYNLTDPHHPSTSANVTKCLYGWDYDDTWFSLTVVSQMNWVCDNKHVVSDVLFYSQNVGVALGLLFGYIGDMFGRRPLLLLCLAAHAASRLLTVLTPRVLVLFILAVSVVTGAGGPTLDSALSVGLELTDKGHRTAISLLAHCSMGVGMSLAGLVAWLLPNWIYFLSLVAACHLPLFVFHRWFPESPRWLACKGKEQQALSVLRRIAYCNNSTLPRFTSQVVHTVGKSKADRVGFLSIFSSWNVLRNTALLIFTRSVYLLTFYSPMTVASKLSVNPFLSVAAQGLAQFVAYFVVNCCASRFGRRWTAVAAPLLAGIASCATFYMLTVDVGRSALVVVLTVIELGATCSGGMTDLQSIELHPTCLRQIAVAVEWTVAGIALSALPYLTLMNDKRLPFAIIAGLNFLAASSVSFLPESAMQKLPETLEDAATFGKGQRYWSWKPLPPPEYISE